MTTSECAELVADELVDEISDDEGAHRMSDRTEFIEAAKAQAFAYRGRTIIHCMGTFTGADWDLAGVVSAIEAANSVRWTKNLCDHELEVEQVDGKVWRFDVRRPTENRAVAD